MQTQNQSTPESKPSSKSACALCDNDNESGTNKERTRRLKKERSKNVPLGRYDFAMEVV